MTKRAVTILCCAMVAMAVPVAAQDQGVLRMKMTLQDSVLSGGESSKGRVAIDRDPAKPRAPVVVRLSSSHALVRFSTPEITIPATDSVAPFEMYTTTTAVRTPVTLYASISPTLQATFALDLVPALLKAAALSRISMFGTFGQSVTLTVELKTPAPQGGIELYLGPYILSPTFTTLRADAPLAGTVRVAAGSRTVTAPINYLAVLEYFSAAQTDSPEFRVDFESQTRKVDIVVALDPQPTATWKPIPDRAIKAGFDLIPLRVGSFTVQPATISSGGEAVATFSLNAPPGTGEEVALIRASGTRLAVTGSSCLAASTSAVIEMPLTAGATSQSFKLCAVPVTAPTSSQVRVLMRSGEYATSVTVQP